MNILLGVSGSIAAYRAADLARELMRSGHTVRVCLTDSAAKFVTPALFEALTGQPCLVGVFEEPEAGRMAHIDWARWAELIAIVPATANTLNKLAAGVGDDMLTTICLASTAPILVAPAMNPQMYASELVQASLNKLEERGVEVIEPLVGDVACGENGQGKLASIEQIAAEVLNAIPARQTLAGKRVLITSGPTREPIDDVRFITNRSSGKMGEALAKAALRLGADVTVVAGPQAAAFPSGVRVHKVETAEQMLAASLSVAPDADLIIGAAAVADYRVSASVSGKIRRTKENLQLELVPNPDIIAELAKIAPKATVIGFAAEPTSEIEVAKAKLERKNLFAVAANDVSQAGIGFDSDLNQLQLVFRSGDHESSPLTTKFRCALWLFDEIISRTNGL